MNTKELKSVLVKIEIAKEKISKERDKLRELYDELENLLDSFDRDIEAIENGKLEIENGIDAISEVVCLATNGSRLCLVRDYGNKIINLKINYNGKRKLE